MADVSKPIINKIIRSRRRTLTLEITEQGHLIVRAPMRTPLYLIHNFVNEKSKWILNKQALWKTKQSQLQPREFKQGERFHYLGHTYPLEISRHCATHKQALSFDNAFRLAENHVDQAHSLFVEWYRNHALAEITKRATWFSRIYNIPYKRIKISNAKKRWGSCSSQGYLNFSWRLVMAPPVVIDYVIVHELAHLREMNHSPRFWRIVKNMLPEYQHSRRWLDEHGYLLTL